MPTKLNREQQHKAVEVMYSMQRDARDYLTSAIKYSHEQNSVALRNGSDQIIIPKSIEITLESDDLGTIVNKTFSYDGIAPGRSSIYTISFAPEEVNYSNQDWGACSSNVHCKY